MAQNEWTRGERFDMRRQVREPGGLSCACSELLLVCCWCTGGERARHP